MTYQRHDDVGEECGGIYLLRIRGQEFPYQPAGERSLGLEAAGRMYIISTKTQINTSNKISQVDQFLFQSIQQLSLLNQDDWKYT